jgi:hypothetical protein
MSAEPTHSGCGGFLKVERFKTHSEVSCTKCGQDLINWPMTNSLSSVITTRTDDHSVTPSKGDDLRFVADMTVPTNVIHLESMDEVAQSRVIPAWIPDYLRPGEAAAILDMSYDQLHYWTHEKKKIKVEQYSDSYGLYRPEALVEFCNKHRPWLVLKWELCRRRAA